MALDYEAALVGAVWTALAANSGVTSVFKVGNRLDERTDGPRRQRIASRAPNDQTSIAVEVIGGEEQSTRTPHFGLTGTVQTCDAIIPVTVTLRITLKFDSSKLGDQTPPETAVRRALHQGYPKLGLSYVRDFTIRKRRTPSATAPGEVTKVELDLAVTMRLHLSQLRD